MIKLNKKSIFEVISQRYKVVTLRNRILHIEW
jgi:hypothetical protein